MSAPDEVLIGPYLARSKIGEGGMGVVYLATDPSGRDVAIKVLRANVVGDDEARARMAREVTSLRRVRSSRVAEVYDADPWGETPYLVTRFVSGPSLHDQVQQSGPLTGMQLRDLTVGLAEAVVAVHAADVVHRDIKPSNVLLQNGNPVLIDFGIAQLADDSKLTSNGWLLGTPGYLAPEILYGGEPSPQADVHSWAATVAYAATGRAPYGSGPAVAVIDRVRRGEHDLSGIPDELRWVLQRSMAPDPAERPTPKQLLVMLTGVPDQTTVHPLVGGAPPTTPYTAGVQGPPPQAQPSHAQPLYPQPTQVAAAHRPMQAPAPAQSSMALEVLFWLGMLNLLIAGVVTAPVIGAAGLIAVCWLLRSIAVRNPVTALPATIAHAAFVLLDGASVVLLITVATPPKTHAYALMAGAFVAGLFAWWGPLSGDVRAGGKIVTDAILVPRPRAIGVLAVVALLCIGVFIVHQRSGPTYSPLPDPPWKPLIADHV